MLLWLRAVPDWGDPGRGGGGGGGANGSVGAGGGAGVCCRGGVGWVQVWLLSLLLSGVSKRGWTYSPRRL